MLQHQSHEQKILLQTAILIAIAWTLLVGGSLTWELYGHRLQVIELASKEARINFNKDISFRSWVASHGGVYVPVTELTPPNPYLVHIENRDIKAADGRTLTLMNPAYVMRQLHKEYSERFGIHSKITSLNLLNPNNAPDEWETRALKTFDTGTLEFSEVLTVDGKPVLRTMFALVAERDCLKCHAQQGYKVGDIRGGLGTTIDLQPYLDNERRTDQIALVVHLSIWLAGALAIFFVFRLFMKRAIERAKAIRELADSQLLFKTVTEHSSAWIFWRNPDGSLRYVSPACESICGYSSAELIARPTLFAEMVHPDDRSLWENHVQEADAAGNPKPFEYRILTKQGQLRWISHVCCPIYDDGNFIGVRGSNSDVTEKHHNSELMIMQSRHAAMGEMVSNIAHQWRQPLTTLGLMAQNLRMDFIDQHLTREELENYTQKSQQIVNDMSATIDDFRNFFKPNKDKCSFKQKQSVTSALNLMGAALTSHDIRVSLDIPEDLSAYGFPNEYSQTLLNILANAKDAIVAHKPSHGQIDIRGYRDGGYAVLSIADNGGGIPEDIIDKIFDPYFTTKHEGSGIGLYMTRIIIEQNMGGNISACNTGTGAEFTLTLPTIKNEEEL